MRLQKTFARLKKENKSAFITFLTAGDPDYKTSKEIISTAQKVWMLTVDRNAHHGAMANMEEALRIGESLYADTNSNNYRDAPAADDWPSESRTNDGI